MPKPRPNGMSTPMIELRSRARDPSTPMSVAAMSEPTRDPATTLTPSSSAPAAPANDSSLMPFGLGLGILFLALYPGRSANKFGLLTGQIISVDIPQLGLLVTLSVVVLVALLVVWRPLTFDSLDADVAAARGVPSRALSLGFMVLLGLTVAVSVQIIGSLLVLALLVTPAAAALRVSSSPLLVPLLSMLFGFVSAVGGILLALGGSLPISPYITTISFLIYIVCRIVGARKAAGGRASARRTLQAAR